MPRCPCARLPHLNVELLQHTVGDSGSSRWYNKRHKNVDKKRTSRWSIISDPLWRCASPDTMNETLTFGRWVKRQRAELDLTQEALAEEAGCTPQTLHNYESGTRRPSRELAKRLAEMLQVPVEQREDFVHLARKHTSPPAVPREELERSNLFIVPLADKRR